MGKSKLIVEKSGQQLAAEFRDSLKAIKAGLIERDEDVDAIALAILAKHHGFALGPPGVAKSQMLEAFAIVFSKKSPGNRAVRYFRQLLGRFSAPEDVFGPVSLKGLKEDRYERRIEGFLPDADLAFLDEPYKANAGILNGLLTITNERQFSQNGRLIDAPLLSLLTASNELPQDDSLWAMHDRLLLRLNVKPIVERANLVRLVTEDLKLPEPRFTLDDLHQMQHHVRATKVPLAVAEAYVDILVSLRDKGINVSNRRMRWAVDIIRAHAWMNGRHEAVTQDLVCLRHILWTKPDQIPDVDNVVLEKANPAVKLVRGVQERVFKALKDIEAKQTDQDKLVQFTETLPHLNKDLSELEDVIEAARAEGHDVVPLEQAQAAIEREVDAVREKYLPTRRKSKRTKATDEQVAAALSEAEQA